MMTGPLNLQCPACGHVFMSMHQRADSMEACPHCSFSGQRPHFIASTQSLAGQPLQVVRRTPRRPVIDPGQMAFDFNQPAPQQAPPVQQAEMQQPAWPQQMAPDPRLVQHQPPQQTPSRTWQTYTYPPAEPAAQPQPVQQPEAALHWEPAIAQPEYVIPPEMMPQQSATAPPMQQAVSHEMQQPHSDPLESYLQQMGPPPGKSGSQSAAASALWPGLDATETGLPVIEEPIAPVKKTAWGLWITVSLLFILACGVAGLLGWEQVQRRIRQLSSQPQSAEPPAASSADFSALAAKPQGMSGLDQRIAVGAAMADAETLTKNLFQAASIKEKLACIADPAEHEAEVARMFDGSSDEPAFINFVTISNPPLDLATGRLLPMFRVVTSKNRSGALIMIASDPAAAKPAILWPLFHETHEGALARHLLDKSEEPRWFHVGMRLSHSFDLPAASRENYLSFDIDGSTDGSGRITAFAIKDSPIGRKLERQTDWGRFYFGRVLAAWMDIAGRKRLMILDCSGSQEEPLAEDGAKTAP